MLIILTIINEIAMKSKMPPSHPGAILREDILRELNISITKAANGLQISRKQLSKIVNESASITPEMALRLEKGFGVEARFWLDLQLNFDLWKIHSSQKLPDIQPITA